MERTTVLYDADCGLCRWSADLLRRWDRHGRLRFVGLQAPEAGDLLPGFSEQARFGSWHAVDPGGQVRSGGAAVPAVLRLLPGGGPLAAIAERFPRATERAYRGIADRREALGRLLGPKACAVDPSRR